MPKTRNFQVYQCYNVVFFSLKNIRLQYKKGQSSKKDGNYSSKISIYHSLIYGY